MQEILKYQTELLEQILSRIGTQPITVQPPAITIPQQPVRGDVQVLNTVRATITHTVPVSQDGNWVVAIQPPEHKYAIINANTSGYTTVVSAVSEKRIVVVAFGLVANGEVVVKFATNSTDITGSMKLVEGGGIAHAYEWGLFRTNIGEALRIHLSSNTQVGGYLVYKEV